MGGMANSAALFTSQLTLLLILSSCKNSFRTRQHKLSSSRTPHGYGNGTVPLNNCALEKWINSL